MPVLESTKTKTTKALQINIDKNLAGKIERYCQYAGIKNADEFIEKATKFVFNKDKAFRTLEKKRQGAHLEANAEVGESGTTVNSNSTS